MQNVAIYASEVDERNINKYVIYVRRRVYRRLHKTVTKFPN